jgi:hypothetical protein
MTGRAAHNFTAPVVPSAVKGRERPILELLPLLRGLVVLPMNHMAINLLGRAYRPVPQACGHRRQWYAAGQ